MNAGELIKKGNQLKRERKISDAKNCYIQSIEINPNFAWSHYYLAEILDMEGNYSEAIDHCNYAIKINPKSSLFHHYLGKLLSKTGKIEQAVQSFQKSINIKPNFDDFYISLNDALSESEKLKSTKISLHTKILKKLKIKTILLTGHYFNIYSGAELVVFDLLKIFTDLGTDVTIAAFMTGEQMISTVASYNVEVINVIDNPEKIAQRKFDLAWCHHFPVIDYCVHELGVNANYMVYSSLSPYEPLEKITYIDSSDLILFNSQENQQIQTLGIDEKYLSKISVFNNSLISDWFLNSKQTLSHTTKQLPRNIVVISNHVPPEIKNLPDLLSEHNIKLHFIGLENKQELVTPELIDSYDAVITIGHTVQKAISRKIPVYCYDIFGGPGWITKNNLVSAEYFNFSGRCCNRKLKTEDIKDEIIQGYSMAIQDLNYLFNYSKSAYSIEKNLFSVLKKIKLSDTSFVEKLYNYPLESYQIRKTSQLYIYNRFKVGSNRTIAYIDNSKLLWKNKKKILLNPINFHDYDQNLLWGFNIDSLSNRQMLVNDNQIILSGWILGKKSHIIQIEVICNDNIIEKVLTNQARPDVALAYPHVPNAEISGFETVVNIGELLNQGELLIRAVCSNKSYIPLKKVQFQVVAAEKQ